MEATFRNILDTLFYFVLIFWLWHCSRLARSEATSGITLAIPDSGLKALMQSVGQAAVVAVCVV